MKASEIRELSDKELGEKLRDLKADNPKRLSDVKKDIARVKTQIRANELKSAQ